MKESDNAKKYMPEWMEINKINLLIQAIFSGVILRSNITLV